MMGAMLLTEKDLAATLAEWLGLLHHDVFHVAAAVTTADPSDKTLAFRTLWAYPPAPPSSLDFPDGTQAIMCALRQTYTPATQSPQVAALPIEGFCGVAVTRSLTVTGWFGNEWIPNITPDEYNRSLEWISSRMRTKLAD